MSDKKKLFIGSFGAGNLGDELILLAALDQSPDAVVMTADAKASSQFVQQKISTVRPFPVGFRSWINFASDRFYRSEIFSLRCHSELDSESHTFDQIIFPGGGLFKNNTKAILLWFMTVLWCRILLPQVPIVFMGQGIDWPTQFWLQRMVLWALNQGDLVGVRDEISARNLVKLGFRKKILLQLDTVEKFLGLPEGLDVNVGAEYLPPIKKQKILLNAANSFDYPRLLKNIEQEYGSNIELVFVVFAPSDREQVPPSFVGNVLRPKTFTELKKIFTDKSVAIGQRFHFLIFGQKFCSKVFLLEAPYAPKTEILAEKYGVNVF
jgi:polysaccharide pyruvyl transferase WcaK-like protein